LERIGSLTETVAAAMMASRVPIFTEAFYTQGADFENCFDGLGIFDANS
jgi:hypothetical protein